MTLEEAKILAEQGNTDAMMALVQHYMKDKDNDESYALACIYQERAAEAGDANAIVQLAQASRAHASFMLQMVECTGKDDNTIESLEKCHKWSRKLVQTVKELNIHGETEQFSTEFYLDSIFWLSAIYSLDENYKGILQITEDVAHPVAQALCGMATLYTQSKLTVNSSNRAYTLLKNVEHPSFWDDKYSRTQTLEILRIEVGLAFCKLLRIWGKTNSAYDTLSDFLAKTKDPALKDIIQKEMSNYHKTFLGNYKYID